MSEIRALLSHEWQLLKEIRLKALTDSPEAFTFPLARAQANTDDDWKAFTTLYATTQIAFADGVACGMIGGFFSDSVAGKEGPTVELAAVWVAPAYRHKGIGAALVAAVVDWARKNGESIVQAWILQRNFGAIGFYEQLGFVRTGNCVSDSDDAALNSIQVALYINE